MDEMFKKLSKESAKNGNNRPVGLMNFREMSSPLRGKKVGFLDDLFVLPASRGTVVVDEMFKIYRRNPPKMVGLLYAG